MSGVYDPIEDRLDQVNSNLIDIETALNKTNELLEKILGVLENPPTQKITHVNVNFEAGGHTSDSLVSLIERLKGV